MLSLPPTLTLDVAPDCLSTLRDGLQHEAATVVVDGQLLQRFDSSALAVLLELRRECAKAGKVFAVQKLPARLRELAALYGIDALLKPA
ncbi:STAS domain-containing protein [Rhodoferax sp. OV413]|uniref:STAS domain-containing protein n=1 Tax=Rhodoferax sp. OV413 TaxID=1855285 RepID=UPI002600E8BD|nr:STAS domain-containing protein [Rhodoferax sp. OV413]